MRYILSILFIVLISSVAAQAQEVTPSLYLSVQPANPSPGQRVVITANSSDLALGQIPILWKANNETLPSTGQSITINAPQAGNTGVITATVNSAGFSSVTATTILRPAMIDLVWEAVDSYTPPFYKGKALPISNSSLNIVAIPAPNAPKSMNYTWSKDGTILGSLSGLNKNVYSFKNSELSDIESISVTGVSGNFTSTVNKIIQIQTPELVAYKKEGGFIDYTNGSTQSLSTSLSGLIVRLEPFFLSETSKKPRNLIFRILQEGEDITNTEKINELSIANTDRGVGFSDFQINISSPTSLFQTIQKTFTINFN